MKKIVLLAFVLVLVSTAMIGRFVRPVEASGTITIKADGSIDPPYAPINTTDMVTYYFTGNINDSIVVERNNITIDGAGYKLEGTGSGIGISLSLLTQNVTIKNALITSFDVGIYLYGCLHNTISGNNITNNNYGISLSLSTYNNISGNNIGPSEYCIYLQESDYNSIVNNDMGGLFQGFYWGIYLVGSVGNSIGGNNIRPATYYGIELREYSNNNDVYGNTMTNNHDAITLTSSNDSRIFGNTMTDNMYGVRSFSSSGNTFYHNNFMYNTHQAYIETSGYANFWDDGYPSGGNYWSNYTGVDLEADGIGDTEHVIDANNTDHYPLMGMFSDFKATSEHHVQTISNSTISDFQFNGTAVSFNVSGGDGTIGFCRILIPTALMNVTYKVFVNGTEVPYTLLPFSNSTHSYLYFTYNHSIQEVVIIPEFPTWTLMLLILTILTIAIVFYKRRLLKTPSR